MSGANHPSPDPMICTGVVPDDGHIYRHFKLLTNGEDKPLDALHIAYTVLSELEDGGDLEAALRYLIARFSIRLPFQIMGRDR